MVNVVYFQKSNFYLTLITLCPILHTHTQNYYLRTMLLINDPVWSLSIFTWSGPDRQGQNVRWNWSNFSRGKSFNKHMLTILK